ncbi:helix-turn-helix domain-containing protein [Streptococcus sciuri]|uniref:Helix-turn-helix domain-containing protein n=1 Tax=Streptococcus sciuri TaxID=2973939 RepID=A0ABT2F950_9STRE|nr:XRE family transcriptional regulator [Streptococcus sciuri]MCS4488930.1 helix-turn-helix domain-containing protein [Streptococcus sciuri]
MNELGIKVRQLRENKGLTREEFCGNESELSIRQLARIENGNNNPNVVSIRYIANRLGMTVGELVDDQDFSLSADYLELKQKLLRIPTYGDQVRLEEREQYFTAIYENFYDKLPEDEQLIIDCLQSKLDVHFSDNDSFGLGILQDYFEQTFKKTTYTVNDFVFFDLYLVCFAYKKNQEPFYEEQQYDKVMTKLLNSNPPLAEEKFQLNNVLLNNIKLAFDLKKWDIIEQVVTKSNQLMTDIHDFQKRPILSLIEWKYQLHVKHNIESATQSYQNAILFAKLIGDDYLENQLCQEWKTDIDTM